jgi:hypothetical protein
MLAVDTGILAFVLGRARVAFQLIACRKREKHELSKGHLLPVKKRATVPRTVIPIRMSR